MNAATDGGIADVLTPPGVAPEDLLWGAQHSAWAAAGANGAGYRTWACQDDVVLFGYTYLWHHLSSIGTGGRVSFARHHLQMAAAAERWSDQAPHRDIVIAPRESAKSTWAVIAILHAMAYRHRPVWLIIGRAERDIGVHMETIRTELRDNALLLNDFPGLRPTRANNKFMVICRSGAAVGARSLEAAGAGFKVDAERPSGIWLDDIEDIEEEYSIAEAKRRLSSIRNKVLPMNDRAAVLWTGTVTMHGSLLHGVVLGVVGEEKMPAWVLDGRWTVHYVPGLQVDARGREHSYWEVRHPLAEQQRIRHTYDHALNFQGRPPHPGAAENMWRPELIRYLAEPVQLVDRLIRVDVSVSGASTKARHDYMAVCVAGRPAVGLRKAVIEYARAFKMTGGQLLALLGELCEEHPDIRVVRLEKNQGGELWREILSPMPRGVELELTSATEPKPVRIRRLLRRYEREEVIHAWRHVELEEGENGLLRFPAVAHDDLIDVVAAAVEDLVAA